MRAVGLRGTMAPAACRREGAMSRSGWKWSAVGVVSLLLLVLGAHLTWERHRYRLVTPRGTVHIGMSPAEMRAALGPAIDGSRGRMHMNPNVSEWWSLEEGVRLLVFYDRKDRVGEMYVVRYPDLFLVSVPRPSLVEVVRSWFGKRGE